LKASTEREVESAFATVLAEHAGAMVVVADPFFFLRREQFAALAARHAVPTIHFFREFVIAGGLMSYGTSLSDGYRQMASMSAGSSRAKSQPICRSCNRQDSRWSSTWRQQRRSA
jgi:hypothetical protein